TPPGAGARSAAAGGGVTGPWGGHPGGGRRHQPPPDAPPMATVLNVDSGVDRPAVGSPLAVVRGVNVTQNLPAVLGDEPGVMAEYPHQPAPHLLDARRFPLERDWRMAVRLVNRLDLAGVVRSGQADRRRHGRLLHSPRRTRAGCSRLYGEGRAASAIKFIGFPTRPWAKTLLSTHRTHGD